MAKVHLRELNHTVRVAETPAVALEDARAWDPNAILVDLEVPDGSGLDVRKTLRQEGRCGDHRHHCQCLDEYRDRGDAGRRRRFLDAIGEMPLDMQVKLLRFPQTGTLQLVGGSKPETVDVRLVCATSCDPLAEVAAGRFREDLHRRPYVVPIELPALRARAAAGHAIARHSAGRPDLPAVASAVAAPLPEPQPAAIEIQPL